MVRTDNPNSWSTALRWLDDCVTSHGKCQNVLVDPTWMPTRLIEIDSCGKHIKIVETAKIPGRERYLTLSHCWGGKAPVLLTPETYKEYTDVGLEVSSLSKTFRDAISVTQRLGTRFLWIDSLCIIQGSDEDWKREAPLMNQVYQNTYCNIAALGAHDSTGGLFFERAENFVEPTTISMRFESGLGSDWNFDLEDRDAFHIDLHQARLCQRGWVVQERILSPRILYFGRQQLFWECRECVRCETVCTATTRPLPSYRITTMESFIADWYQISSLYSKTKLSFSSDRMIAIAGVAKHFADLSGMSYVVGMWAQNLPRELVWFSTTPGVPVARTLDAPPGEEPYIGSSWSWLSINSAVNCTAIRAPNGMVIAEVIGACWMTLHPTSDVSGSKKRTNPSYGWYFKGRREATDLSAVLDASWGAMPVLKVNCHLCRLSTLIDETGTSRIKLGPRLVNGILYPDFVYGGQLDGFFMPVTVSKGPAAHVWGLILRRYDLQVGAYVRVGAARFQWDVLYSTLCVVGHDRTISCQESRVESYESIQADRISYVIHLW